MTNERKVIRAKLGLLELAKQLGNVSQACKIMGYSRDSSHGVHVVKRYLSAALSSLLVSDPRLRTRLIMR
jgi:hypothetical protein